jgi:hypothetical protein
VIAGIAVGTLFAAAGLLILPRRRHEELHTYGTVAKSWRGHSGGSPSWRYTIEFRDANGTVWTFEPDLTPGRRQVVGTQVQVAYRLADPPSTARRTDGFDGYFPWFLVSVGVLTAVVFSILS